MRYLVLSAVLLVGCGHPATVEECETIVERVVELELKQRNRSGEAEIRATAEKTKQAVHDATMNQCVGRRITKEAMDCVRAAKTSQDLVNDCFDGWR